MSNLKWITLWFAIPLFLVIALVYIMHFSQMPYRFSKSISYDIKVKFLKEENLLDSANVLIVGSSMALNNIDGPAITANSIKVKKIVNLASWGINPKEVLDFVRTIELNHIDYIIYPNQYIDFSTKDYKNINIKETEKYLKNKVSLSSFFYTMTKLPSNIKSYVNYQDLYQNPNKYSYLNFDITGGALLKFGESFISAKRWNVDATSAIYEPGDSFEHLLALNQLSKQNGAKLIVCITPIREEVLGDKQVKSNFKNHSAQLKKLSKLHDFIYFNAQDQLKLDDSHFVDKMHLNHLGAGKISDLITTYIEEN